MSDIEFKENAVCYAGGEQYKQNFNHENVTADLIGLNVGHRGGCNYMDLDDAVKCNDFQLNEPRQGDYIPKSELDTEQKYNDAVEVFGLFGFKRETCYATMLVYGGLVIDAPDSFCSCTTECRDIIRKITYNQLMAIGKLKRLMNERDKVNTSEKPNGSEFDNNLTFSANKYEREISDRQGNSAIIDVYDVLKAFEVSCPATQHAVKKLLCSGIRGHKDLSTDLIEAKESIVRAIELNG